MRRKLLIYYLVMLSVLIGASAAFPTPLWGAGAWSSVSFTFGLVLALTLIVGANRKVSDRLLGILPEGPTLPRFSALTALPLLLVVFWLLRPGHLLLGGMQAIVTRTAGGMWTSPAAPIATAATQAVFRAVNSLFFVHPETAVSIVSVVLAVPFLFAARYIAISLTGDDASPAREWFPAAAMIFAGGYSIVFFGGDSTMAAAVTLSALFIASSLRHLDGRAPVYLPVSVFLLALFTHYSNLFLAPGAAYLLVRSWKGKKTRVEAAAAFAAMLIAVAAIDLILSLAGTGPRPSTVFSAALGRASEALFSNPPGETFADWGNVLLVLGPVVLFSMIMAVTGKRQEREEVVKDPFTPFLVVTCLASLVFMLAASPLIQRGLHWEIFASTGPVFAALALALMKRKAASGREMAHGSLMILLLSLFHLTSLIGIGASRTMGIDRLERLPIDEGMAEKIVGMDLLAAERYEEASDWLGRSAEKREGDGELWFALGTVDMKNEEFLDAISHFNRAVKISPDYPEYREELAEAYIEQRWFEEAVSELEKLTAGYPSETGYMVRLGYAYNHGSMYEKAVATYKKVYESEPGNMQYRRNLASALLNLGAAYHEEKDYEKAEESYRKVLALLPTSWIAKNNLAMVYMDREDYEEAYRILEDAIRVNDMAARLHFNMALVQEQRGEYEDAFDHITKSVELSPGLPAPESIMRRIWEKAEAQKEQQGK